MLSKNVIKAISLFSGAGIGEYYLNDCGVEVILANEIIPKRAKTHEYLYPNCEMVNEDITKKETQKKLIVKALTKGASMVIATPPCQGLSTAGVNRTDESLLKDPRNFLILSALKIVDGIKPDYVIVENVPRFQQMLFPWKRRLVNLFDLLVAKYSKEYYVAVEVFNAADYGVPQNRLRVVYRMWKKKFQWRIPDREQQITLREAIGDLPSLEAGEASEIKNHIALSAPLNHVLCMRHTPEGMSAFRNEFYYPKKADGTRIKGYPNTYKRMRWNFPAPTITMRNEIISSQENVHPGRAQPDGTQSDARVLTLRELLIVSSLPPDLDKPNFLTETAFRQIIGEGIPSRLMERLVGGIRG